MKKVLSLVLALVMVLSMVSLASASETLPYAEGTVLRMAVGYNNSKTGLRFDPEVAGEGVTLADGVTYHSGDFKPTWVAVQDLLKISIEDKYQGNGASKEFDYWKEQLDQVDMVAGTAAKLSENGEAGLLVNIGEYLDQMPNFKAYLDANPIVRLSITGNVENGAIYFSPYFDGVNDIEKMPLMRTDWVQKLLNGEGEFTAESVKVTNKKAYTPYMPTSGKVEVEVVKADGSGVETITKDYDAYGNIIDKMNAAMDNSLSGDQLVNMLREYIDKTYNGYYGTERADLFIGQNAAWDADELVALLRCVVNNPNTLNGTDNIEGLFSREENNTARRADIFRFGGTLFGVRGLESRQDYLYIGTDNMLHDARQEVATYEALGRLHAMVEEGLISTAYVNGQEVKTENYLEQDLGFMHYDYNQTQTVYNATKLDNAAGEKYMAVMIPVARWYDGSNEEGVYMRFTESWRSVKTDGWGISVAGVGDNTDKLNAALALIDYAYSPEGVIRMSYGPDEFIKKKDDGSYETFTFNGQEMPVIADATWEELWSLGKGNYTNYARQYLGSTLSFMKSQAFEYQCTCDAGKEGAGKISKAIALGTIKHPLLEIDVEDPWYISVPTVLPTTKEENAELGGFTDLNSKFQAGKDQENILVDIIAKGFTVEGMGNAEEAAAFVTDNMMGGQYLTIKEGAWEELLAYAVVMSLLAELSF